MRLLTVVTLTLLVAFTMGCSRSATDTPPATTPTSEPDILSHQLKVIADPQQAANFLFNPNPIGQGLFVHGRTVTIDVLPESGWEIGEWVGPVFEVAGRTAKIRMDSSQTVVVRLVQSSTPATSPASTTGPLARPEPTAAERLAPPASPGGTFGILVPSATLTSAPTADPHIPGPAPCLAIARAAYFESQAFDRQGEYEKAIEKLDEVIRLDPQCAVAYSSRGFAELHLGQNQRALQDYDEAIRLAPEAGDLYNSYYNRGFVYSDLGQHRRGIQDFNEAIRLLPGQSWLYDGRAMIYERLGDEQRAKADRDTACQLDRAKCEANLRPIQAQPYAGVASFYTPSDHMGGLEVTANQSVAQTFTVISEGTLTGAAIVGINHHRCTPVEQLRVRLLATLNGLPSSQVFYENVVPPESVPEKRGTIEISFGPDGWPVGKNEILALELSSIASPGGCTYGWDGDAPGNYSGGQTYIAHKNGSGWVENGRDMGFRVFLEVSPK